MADSSKASAVSTTPTTRGNTRVFAPPQDLLEQYAGAHGCLADVLNSVGRSVSITGIVEVTSVTTTHKKDNTGAEFSIIIIGDQYTYVKLMVSGVPDIHSGNWYEMKFSGKVKVIHESFNAPYLKLEVSVTDNTFKFDNASAPSPRLWPVAHLKEWFPSVSQRVPEETFVFDITVGIVEKSGILTMHDKDAEEQPIYWLQVPPPPQAMQDLLKGAPLYGSSWKLRGIPWLHANDINRKDGKIVWAKVSITDVVWMDLLGTSKRDREDPSLQEASPPKKPTPERVNLKK